MAPKRNFIIISDGQFMTMLKKTTVQDPYNFEASGGTHNAFFLCLQNLERTLTSKKMFKNMN